MRGHDQAECKIRVDGSRVGCGDVTAVLENVK